VIISQNLPLRKFSGGFHNVTNGLWQFLGAFVLLDGIAAQLVWRVAQGDHSPTRQSCHSRAAQHRSTKVQSYHQFLISICAACTLRLNGARNIWILPWIMHIIG